MPGEYEKLVYEYGMGAGLGVKFNSQYSLTKKTFGFSSLVDWSVGVMLGPDSGGGIQVGNLVITRNGSIVTFSLSGVVSFSADIKNDTDAVALVVRKVGDRYSIFAYGKEYAYQSASSAGFSGFLIINSPCEIYSFGVWIQDDYKDVIYMVSGIPIGAGVLFAQDGIYYLNSNWTVEYAGAIRSSDVVEVVKFPFPVAIVR